MIIKIEGPVGFGPYRYRRYFLNKLWEETEQQIEEWLKQDKAPYLQEGFMEYRLRLRRAKALHYRLENRYPNPTTEFLKSLGSYFTLKP